MQAASADAEAKTQADPTASTAVMVKTTMPRATRPCWRIVPLRDVFGWRRAFRNMVWRSLIPGALPIAHILSAYYVERLYMTFNNASRGVVSIAFSLTDVSAYANQLASILTTS